jgi:hypothetical protein
MLRTVTATRYVTALREGGSLPGLVEADDLGMYVVKFRGAGQGRKALVAEIIAGELIRRLGLRVPEIVFVELDPDLERGEPDQEVQDLLKSSAGLNIGMDYLPGSYGFDPPARIPDPAFAARVLWLDALIVNVDRSWHNPNLLVWGGEVWLIDHGASFYFHHSWDSGVGAAREAARRAYPVAADHVLLPFAAPLDDVDGELATTLTPDVIREVLGLVPDDWLQGEPGPVHPEGVRAAYAAYFAERLTEPRTWVEALEVTRAARV